MAVSIGKVVVVVSFPFASVQLCEIVLQHLVMERVGLGGKGL